MPDFLRRRGLLMVVVVLLIVDAVLIALAVSRQPVARAVPAVPTPDRPLASGSPPPTATPTPQTASASPSPSPSPGSAKPAAGASPTGRPRLLASGAGSNAWRAEPTGCSARSMVEVSTDGGRTWTRTNPGLRAVVRLKTFGVSGVFAVGADADCRPTFARTDGPGQPWRVDRTGIADKWYRVPGKPDTVHAPGGDTSRPCGSDLTDLAGLGTYQAAALCADGRIRTIDQGRGWRTVQKRSGGVALNADDAGFVAARRRSGCRTVSVVRFDVAGAGLRRAGDCLPGSRPAPGRTAVSVSGGSTWVWNARTTVRRAGG